LVAVALAGVALMACSSDSSACDDLRERVWSVEAEAEEIGAVSWDEVARIQELEEERQQLEAEVLSNLCGRP